jgi:GntR family transcriptional regulator, transcriptional repressor for pyruvate dehydrogenase complex
MMVQSTDVLDSLHPVRQRTVVNEVAAQLLELLRSGALSPGDRLPAEREIASRLHVARASVRAAIAHLQAARIVATEAGRRGTVVLTRWVPDDLGSVAAPNHDRFRALLEARRVLEPALAQLAARRADHAGLDALAAAVAEQEALGDDRPRAVQAEGRFHRLMWRLAGNPPLERAMRDVYVELEAVLDMAMRTEEDIARSLRSHQETLAALRRGEPDAIDAAMSAHLALMEGIYGEVTGRTFRT